MGRVLLRMSGSGEKGKARAGMEAGSRGDGRRGKRQRRGRRSILSSLDLESVSSGSGGQRQDRWTEMGALKALAVFSEAPTDALRLALR